MDDLQFAQRYGQLLESIGGGECAVYEFHNEVGTVRSIFLKREIPIAIDGQTYFEAVTPCAYGGPVILACKEGRRWELTTAFERAFRKYCLEQNIISERVQFNPLLGNAADFAGCYETGFTGDTAAIDLRLNNPICSEFSERGKKMLFQALEYGIDARVAAGPSDAARLAEQYLSISDQQHPRGSSLDRYLLADCIEKLGPHLVVTEAVYKERTIAMSLSLFNEGVLQLEGIVALPSFAHLQPEHVLQYGLMSWGKQHGASFIHLGAIGSDDADSALNEQFSHSTRFESWAGRKIWNQEAYNKLCGALEPSTGFDGLPLEWQTAPLGFSFT